MAGRCIGGQQERKMETLCGDSSSKASVDDLDQCKTRWSGIKEVTVTRFSTGLNLKNETGKEESQMTPWLRHQASKMAAPLSGVCN